MGSKKHRLRRGLVLATVVSALAAPAASARPIDLVPSTASDAPQQQQQAQGGGVNAPSPAPAPAPAPVTVSGDGFDWGDAGIGATGMLALVAIAAGAVVATGRRLSRHEVA